MGLRINTNVQSIAAQRNLNTVRNDQDKSLERLSSGNRIVRAGDDAAGLAISENLKAEIRGTRQASRNANDGISLIQTAEGSMNEISNILIRLRELSVQAASDTIGEEERKFSDLEFQNMVSEINRISSSTKFNGRQLLNGEGSDVEIQIGTSSNKTYDSLAYQTSSINATVDHLGLGGLTIGSKEEAQHNLDEVDKAINLVNGNRASLGALQNRLGSTISNLAIKDENLSAANSRVRDTDVALESAELMKTNILTQAGTSVLSQANTSKQMALRLLNS